MKIRFLSGDRNRLRSRKPVYFQLYDKCKDQMTSGIINGDALSRRSTVRAVVRGKHESRRGSRLLGSSNNVHSIHGDMPNLFKIIRLLNIAIEDTSDIQSLT